MGSRLGMTAADTAAARPRSPTIQTDFRPCPNLLLEALSWCIVFLLVSPPALSGLQSGMRNPEENRLTLPKSLTGARSGSYHRRSVSVHSHEATRLRMPSGPV